MRFDNDGSGFESIKVAGNYLTSGIAHGDEVLLSTGAGGDKMKGTEKSEGWLLRSHAVARNEQLGHM